MICHCITSAVVKVAEGDAEKDAEEDAEGNMEGNMEKIFVGKRTVAIDKAHNSWGKMPHCGIFPRSNHVRAGAVSPSPIE